MTAPSADSDIATKNQLDDAQPQVQPVALVPKIPLELVPHVVVHLSDLLPVLKTCSLASQSFLKATRPHLHSRLTINLEARKASKTINRLECYFDNPPLIGCVQSLVLIYPFDADQDSEAKHEDDATHFERLFCALGPLPNIKHLTLDRIDFADTCRDKLSSYITHNLPGVHTLVVGSQWNTATGFASLDQLSSLIRSLPLLRSIDLGRVSVRGIKEEDVPEEPTKGTTYYPLMRLDSLRLSGPRSCGLGFRYILKLLGIDHESGSEGVFALQRLSLHQQNNREDLKGAFYRGFCELFGPSLRHLELDIDNQYDMSHDDGRLDIDQSMALQQRILSKCNHLETLVVKTTRTSFDPDWLLHLPSSHFKKLTLCSKKLDVSRIDQDLRFSKLEEVLEQKECKVEEILISLSVRHRMTSLLQEIKDEISEAMPKTSERGVIRFEYYDLK